MWAKIGIQFELDLIEMVAARAKLKTMDFEMTSHRAVISLEPQYIARMFTCDGTANWSSYCNPEVDKCMGEALTIYDANKRGEVYKRCQKILYEDAQIGGLYRNFSFITQRKVVKGLRVQYDSMDLSEVWLDK